MKWEDIYKVWKWEMCKFPVLSAQKYCLKTEISKPRFGPCYSFNWIEKEREKESIESDVAALTSGRMEIEAGWSKGTIRTAALLCSCEKEEEFAAVWICAFVLSLTRGRSGGERLIEMHLTWNMRQLLCLRENMAIGIQIQENFSRNFIFLWNCFGKIKNCQYPLL